MYNPFASSVYDDSQVVAATPSSRYEIMYKVCFVRYTSGSDYMQVVDNQ
jgi:hypothetical protein